MGSFLEGASNVACRTVVLPEEEPDACCNYGFDVDRRMALGMCGHGYVPLRHLGTRWYVGTRLTTNNMGTKYCSNDPGHMTNMAATPIYSKNL